MIVVFEQQYLSDLYEKGKSEDKKNRYQPDIIRRYQKCIKFMMAASNISALAKIHSLNIEKLSGDKKNVWSARVNDKYRIEFDYIETGVTPQIAICYIKELSNHYK